MTPEEIAKNIVDTTPISYNHKRRLQNAIAKALKAYGDIRWNEGMKDSCRISASGTEIKCAEA